MSGRHSGLGRGIEALFPADSSSKVNSSEEEKNKESSAEKNLSTKTSSTKTSSKKSSAKTSAVKTSSSKNDSAKTSSAKSAAKSGKAGAEGMNAPAASESSAVSQEEKKTGSKIVRITSVEPNRKQPRQNFDEEALNELADSIKKVGLIEPLIVSDKGNHYEIVAGERRWRAAKIAGVKEIPVVVRDYSDSEIMEIALIENLQRQDLNPIEEAKAYESLIREHDLTQEEVADKVSRSRSAITNTMRLLKLADEVQNMLIRGDISMGHARALLGLNDAQVQVSAAELIRDKGLSVREAEQLVKRLSDAGNAAKKKQKAEADPAIDAICRQLEEKIKTSLGTRIAIKPDGKKGGKIEISFFSYDELDRITDRLLREN